MSEVSVTSLRPGSFGGKLNATVEVEKGDSSQLIRKGRIEIGWVLCRIRVRAVVVRCFNYQELGHLAVNCKKRSGARFYLKCGKEDHKVKECPNEEFCTSF